MISKGEALYALAPNAEWAMDGDYIEWFSEDISQPSEEDIIRKQAEMQYEYEVKEYQRQRKLIYPSRDEQFDMMYWDKINGTTTWDDAINAVKEAYPKVEVDETIKQQKSDEAWFNKQLADYADAVDRLSHYELSVGKPATDDVTEEVQVDPDVDPSLTTTIAIERGNPAIEAVPSTLTIYESDGSETEVPNPIVVKDEEERAAAQAVVDGTPQEVVDHYNSL